MGRKKHTQELLCLMNEHPVGVLNKKYGQLSFQYKNEWLTSSLARPISLSLPLQEAPHRGEKTHAYFENLLPDNDAIRQQIVERLGATSRHPFDLLRFEKQIHLRLPCFDFLISKFHYFLIL